MTNDVASKVRFVVVGVVNPAVSFVVVTSLLRSEAAEPAPAQAAAYLAGMMTSFALNRRWTFAGRRGGGHVGGQLQRFIVSQAILLAVTSGLLASLSRGALRPTVAWILTNGLATVINYVVQKRWVFTAHADARA